MEAAKSAFPSVSFVGGGSAAAREEERGCANPGPEEFVDQKVLESVMLDL